MEVITGLNSLCCMLVSRNPGLGLCKCSLMTLRSSDELFSADIATVLVLFKSCSHERRYCAAELNHMLFLSGMFYIEKSVPSSFVIC